MNELTDQGVSIIMISSDMPELINMSDRVIVMCDGKITGTLEQNEISQETIEISLGIARKEKEKKADCILY